MDDRTRTKTELLQNYQDQIDEEIFVEDDWSCTEERLKLSPDIEAAQSANTATLSVGDTNTRQPQTTVVDFLRTFLPQMGMTETLDCFEAEWCEMVQKGLLDSRRVDVMPDVYIENQHLETQLKNANKETNEYKLATSAAAEAVSKLQKARDFHWLRHKRIIQEKNTIIEDIRKLTVQCSEYQPKVKEMNNKYHTLLKQTLSMTLQRDKPPEDPIL